jgi:hypothetical protein
VLRKNFQDNRQKVARPILFHNYSRLDDSDPYENRSRIGKTVKLQHFLLDGMNAATRAKTPGIKRRSKTAANPWQGLPRLADLFDRATPQDA